MKAHFVLLLLIIGVSSQKDEDEGRPYEFSFTIDGEQHRYEKKDVNGIIQGEFGFITGDGIYHVSVYATDQNGDFKILSTKNVKISEPLDERETPLADAKSLQQQAISAPVQNSNTHIQPLRTSQIQSKPPPGKLGLPPLPPVRPASPLSPSLPSPLSSPSSLSPIITSKPTSASPTIPPTESLKFKNPVFKIQDNERGSKQLPLQPIEIQSKPGKLRLPPLPPASPQSPPSPLSSPSSLSPIITSKPTSPSLTIPPTEPSKFQNVVLKKQDNERGSKQLPFQPIEIQSKPPSDKFRLSPLPPVSVAIPSPSLPSPLSSPPSLLPTVTSRPTYDFTRATTFRTGCSSCGIITTPPTGPLKFQNPVFKKQDNEREGKQLPLQPKEIGTVTPYVNNPTSTSKPHVLITKTQIDNLAKNIPGQFIPNSKPPSIIVQKPESGQVENVPIGVLNNPILKPQGLVIQNHQNSLAKDVPKVILNNPTSRPPSSAIQIEESNSAKNIPASFSNNPIPNNPTPNPPSSVIHKQESYLTKDVPKSLLNNPSQRHSSSTIQTDKNSLAKNVPTTFSNNPIPNGPSSFIQKHEDTLAKNVPQGLLNNPISSSPTPKTLSSIIQKQENYLAKDAPKSYLNNPSQRPSSSFIQKDENSPAKNVPTTFSNNPIPNSPSSFIQKHEDTLMKNVPQGLLNNPISSSPTPKSPSSIIQKQENYLVKDVSKSFLNNPNPKPPTSIIHKDESSPAKDVPNSFSNQGNGLPKSISKDFINNPILNNPKPSPPSLVAYKQISSPTENFSKGPLTNPNPSNPKLPISVIQNQVDNQKEDIPEGLLNNQIIPHPESTSYPQPPIPTIVGPVTSVVSPNNTSIRDPRILTFNRYSEQPKQPITTLNKIPEKYHSSLSEVTVNKGVINVPGNEPIVIKDRYPNMVDGLPEGITERDITNILYKFNYTVGFHGHYEKGLKNGAKVGGYFVNGRDGISRIVTYIADENGYRPKFRLVNLGLDSPDTPKPDSEKKFGLKNFEFVWYPIK